MRLAALLPLLTLLCAAPAWALPGLFGKGGPGATLSPVRWAQAGPKAPAAKSAAPAAKSAAPGAKSAAPAAKSAAPDQGTSDPGAKPDRNAGRKRGLTAEGGLCRDDWDCEVGTYCEDTELRCVKVERPFNAVYLFYRSGDRRFTEILGIYWHRKGTEGYRVVFPLYWSFWRPDSRERVLFPFYFRLEDDREKITNTFYLPFQYRVTPREKNYRFWPLVMWTDYGPRGSGLTVMPLFHRAREGTRTATAIPLFLSGYNIDPATGLNQGMVLGLYYWHHEGDFHSHAVTPLFYTRRSPSGSFTWVLPLNFFKREGQRRTTVILPFAFHRASPAESTTLGLIPPFYHHRSGDRTRFVGLPLIFAGGDRDSGYGVGFPLYWHFRRGDRSFTLVGPVFHRRNGPRTTAGLFPIALYHRDRQAGDRLGMLLPLFYADSVDHGLRSRIISPLFLYEHDREAGVKHWGLIAPPFYSRRDHDREVDTLIPLFLRWHNKIERSTTWIVGPVVVTRDETGGSQVAFPLFWRFEDKKAGAATSVLFPIFYRLRRPDGSATNILFPFYYKSRPKAWSAGILPLVYAGSSPGRAHLVVFPVLWHVKTASGTVANVLGPLYHRRDAKGWHAGLAPVFFAGAERGDSYQVLFPAFWHLRSQRDRYHVVVAGPGFWASTRKGTAWGVLPLFAAGEWDQRRFQTVLPPLFYRSLDPRSGDNTTLALTYYGWRKGDDRGHLLFPLFYHRRRGDHLQVAGVPLFYYRDRGGDRLLVTPAGGFRASASRSDAVIGPFVYHRSASARGFALVPLVFHWKRPERDASTTVVLPFGVHHSSPQRRAFVWFPVVWRFWEPAQRSLVVFPIYWHLRQREGVDADVVFPLVWSVRSSKRRVHVAGPAFWVRKGSHLTAGVAPLGIYHRGDDASTAVTLPFFVYRNNFAERERTWSLGPLYVRKYEAGYAAGVIPVLFHKRTPERRYTIVAPIFWYAASPLENKRVTVVGPFFERKRGDERALGLLPVFYTAWNRTGDRSLAVFPLFYSRTEVARKALYTLPFGYDRSVERTQWYAAAGLFFHRKSESTSLDLLAPLFLRHRNHLKGQTTLLLPPFFFGQWSAEQAFHLFFPLVWHSRRIDSTATVVFPIFWDFNDRFASRTTVIAPLVLRHRDHSVGSTSWVTPPGIWVRTRRDGTDAVVLPLVYHFGGEKRSTSIGFPLYWDLKRGSSRTTVVAPFYLRLDRPTYRAHLVLNTWWRRTKDKDLFRLIVVPLFQVHRKRPGDIHVDILGGLVGYERVGRNRFMTLFFYTFPLEPAGGKTLSGFGGVQPTVRAPPF